MRKGTRSERTVMPPPQPGEPRSPSAPWPAAPAAKSNKQLLDEITELPADRDKGVWKRLSSPDDGTVHKYVALRHEGRMGTAVSVWLVDEQEDAEHIAQHSGVGYVAKDVKMSLADAKRFALTCAERSLKILKRKRDDVAAAAAAAAQAAPAPGAAAGAGMGPSPGLAPTATARVSNAVAAAQGARRCNGAQNANA